MTEIPELFFEHNETGLANEYLEELAASPLPHGYTTELSKVKV